jgi:hypothetical protein
MAPAAPKAPTLVVKSAPRPPSGRSSLLDAIRGGGSGLKKAKPVEKKKPTGRGAMLDMIRNGRKLKKVVREEKPVEKKIDSGMSSIMDILARRAAIEGSSDEEDSSDGYSDSEWA